MISLDYKAQFLKNETLAKAHRELVLQDSFQVAVEMALLLYISKQSPKSSVDDAMALHRITGAQEFVSVLLNIGEHPQVPKPNKPTGPSYA
jgi:hypothetical protein